MAAGSITVSLLANTGSFDTDIQRSTKATEKRMRELKASAAQWGAAMGAAFTGVAVAGVYMSKQLIDGIDALNDVADATGSTVEKISALEDIADRTGTSMDTVTTAMVKLNDQLGKADGKDGTSLALKAIGLDVEALKKLDPADALLETAKALDKFADDGSKARLVQELFGKSVKEVAPLLKDLAEKGELVATVTSDQAKQAEEFNKQIFDLTKNATDLGRSFVGDIVTGINAAAKALKESGLLEGFRTLFTGSDQYKNDKRLVELTDQLLQAQNALDLSRAKDSQFGDRSLETAANEKRLAGLKAELATVQAYQKVLQGGPAVFGGATPATGAKPTVGNLPAKKDGKDLDADFKKYLTNLQAQGAKLSELSLSTKLLGDIERGRIDGSLTLSDQQIATLKKEAAAQDELNFSMKNALGIATDRQTQRNKDYADAAAGAQAIKDADAAMLRTLLDAGPTAQAEKFRLQIELLNRELAAGNITAEKYRDAIAGFPALSSSVQETKSMTEELGMTFSSAFESAIFGGGKLSDVFKGLLQDIARVILRLQVTEPLLKELKYAMGDGGVPRNPYADGASGGGGGWAQTIFSAIGRYFGGSFADGGMPPVGKVSLVGERGPELFVPRTAGTIIPNNALGDGGPTKFTIVNPPGSRVTDVVEQKISANERVLILREGAQIARRQFVGALADPNSDESRALGKNFRLERTR